MEGKEYQFFKGLVTSHSKDKQNDLTEEFLKSKRSLNGPRVTAALTRGRSGKHLLSRSRDEMENQKHWHQTRAAVEGTTMETTSVCQSQLHK